MELAKRRRVDFDIIERLAGVLALALALALSAARGSAQSSNETAKRATRCLGPDTLPEQGWYCYKEARFEEFSAPRPMARHPDWRIFDERHWNGQKYNYDSYVVDCATRSYGYLGSSAALHMIGLPFYENDVSQLKYSPAETEVLWACTAGPKEGHAP